MKSSTYLNYAITGLMAMSTLSVANTNPSSLHQINHKIHNMKHHLMLSQQQQQQQQHALQSLETHSAKLAMQLHNTNRTIAVKIKNINKLQDKSAVSAKSIATQKKTISTDIKTLYMLGKHSNLQLLLEQDDPAKIERTLTYYHYLNEEHLKQITQLNATLQLAQTTLQKLQQNYQQLRQLKAQQQHQLTAMQQLKIKRNNLIHKIKIDIASDSQKLKTLLHDKRQLEAELRNLSANPLLFKAIGKPFSQLKHHLSWPIKGKLIAKYGTKIDKSQLRWKGVLFKAPMNQPVYAVADGKVVFARWLQGYGLLMIIYHGQGYMTLYGRNHYLYKKTGDLVHAGDQIAAVGDTGGHQIPSLYFAIRHNTLPINPLTWFKRT